MNLAKEGPEFVSVAVGASRSLYQSQRRHGAAGGPTYAEGVQIFKANKAAALKHDAEISRSERARDILDDAYNQFREYLEYPPYVTRKAMENVIADVAVSDAAAKNFKPEDFMDMRFVAELDKPGFFKATGSK